MERDFALAQETQMNDPGPATAWNPGNVGLNFTLKSSSFPSNPCVIRRMQVKGPLHCARK